MVRVFLLLTLNIFHTFSSASIVDSEQVNVSWAETFCLSLVVRYSRHPLSRTPRGSLKKFEIANVLDIQSVVNHLKYQ